MKSTNDISNLCIIFALLILIVYQWKGLPIPRQCRHQEPDNGADPVAKGFPELNKLEARYRLTIELVTNLPLTSKQNFRLAWPVLARPKHNFCYVVNRRLVTT